MKRKNTGTEAKVRVPAAARETLDLLSKSEWVDAISRGKKEVALGVKGESLDQLAD